MLRLAALIFLGATSPLRAELDLLAPNPDFMPVNQLLVSGNGCGPAALLNAFGNPAGSELKSNRSPDSWTGR